MVDAIDRIFDAAEKQIAEKDARIAKLKGRISDYEDDFRRVMAEECTPDEKHCSCVPHLRKRIAELEAENNRLNMKLMGDLYDKSTPLGKEMIRINDLEPDNKKLITFVEAIADGHADHITVSADVSAKASALLASLSSRQKEGTDHE